MNTIGLKKPFNKGLKIIIVLNLSFILLLVFRAFFGAAFMDEAYNVAQAYRLIQGNTFLVDVWELTQTGDVFMFPFFFVYHKITGSSEGIILFSRIIFVVIQVLQAVFVYKILSKYFDKLSVFFSVLIYTSAVQFCLFYMWYDNWEVLFRLIGILLIVYVYCSKDDISHKRSCALIFLAGVVHACMVFAYPTMIIVYLYTACLLFFYKRKDDKKAHNIWPVLYVLGALIVFLIFLAYVFSVGVKKLFIFNNSFLSSGSESLSYFSVWLEKTKLLITDNIEHYLFGLLIYFAEILYCVVFRKREKRMAGFTLIMLLGCLLHVFTNGFNGSVVINLMITYIALYAVPLFFMIDRKSGSWHVCRNLMVVIYISSFLAGLVYNYTSMYGSLKFACGFRVNAIITILLLSVLIKQEYKNHERTFALGVFFTSFVIMNLVFVYVNSYDGSRPFDSGVLCRSGIYKGLFENRETVQRHEDINKLLKNICSENDRTITCGPDAMECYLMTDLKPNVYDIWDMTNTRVLFKYYDKYYGKPDLIVLRDMAFFKTDPQLLGFIREKYDLIRHSDGYLIYHSKE